MVRAVAAAAAVACSEPGDGAPPSPPPRGVVLIVVDTLRADHLGAYGSLEGLTPRLDAFAAEATVFTRAYAASSWTRPSIAALFTSRYPTRLQLHSKRDAIAESALTVAEVLREQGWRTFGVCTNGNADAHWGFDQGFEEFVWPEARASYPDDWEMVPAAAVTGTALGWLADRDPDRPFLLYLLYTDPHDPYLPHPELQPEPAPPGRFDGSRRNLRALKRTRPDALRPEDYARIRHLYEGEVRYLDLWLGELFDGLGALGLYDDVLIVLTADHGEGLWDHGERGHGTDLYDELIRVPLVVRFPERFGKEPGSSACPASHVDVAPTLLAAAGGAIPNAFQGRGLGALLDDPACGPGERFVFSELRLHGRDLEAAMDGVHKLVRNRAFDDGKHRGRTHRVAAGDTLHSIAFDYFGSGRFARAIAAANALPGPPRKLARVELEPGGLLRIPDQEPRPDEPLLRLYDTERDPGERVDVAARRPELRASLAKALARWRQANLRGQGEARREALDAERIEQLRGLGYME